MKQKACEFSTESCNNSKKVFMKSSMNKDIAYTMSGQVGRLVFATLASALLARGLGTDQRGLYAMAIAGPNLMAMFIPLGQLQINQTFAGLHKEYRPQLFVQSFLIALFVSALCAVSYIALFRSQATILGNYDQLSFELVYGGAVLLPFLSFNLLMRELTRGAEFIQSNVVITTFGFALQAVLTGIFVFGFGVGVLEAMGIILVVNFVTIIGYCWVFRFYISEIICRKAKMSREFFKECNRVGVQYLLCSVVINLDSTLPIFVLGYLGASNADIGIFAVGFALAVQMEMVPMSISQVYLPRLSNGRVGYAAETPRLFSLTMISSCFSMLGMLIVGFPLIWLLFGSEYTSSYYLVSVIVPGIVLASGGRILTSYLRVAKKPRYEITSGLLKVATFCIFSIVLYPAMGILGVAMAVTLARLPWILQLVYAYRKESGGTFRELSVCKEDFVLLYRKCMETLPRRTFIGGTK